MPGSFLRHLFVRTSRDSAADSQDLPYELNHVRSRAGKVVVPYASPQETRIEVFWKDFRKPRPDRDAVLENGVGPVISFIFNGRELARFDCLGEKGHFHLALVRPDPGAEKRIFFHEKSCRDQVERAVFELQKNVNYYRKRNPLPEVRDAILDPVEHDRCCLQAREAAMQLLERKCPQMGLSEENPTRRSRMGFAGCTLQALHFQELYAEARLEIQRYFASLTLH